MYRYIWLPGSVTVKYTCTYGTEGIGGRLYHVLSHIWTAKNPCLHFYILLRIDCHSYLDRIVQAQITYRHIRIRTEHTVRIYYKDGDYLFCSMSMFHSVGVFSVTISYSICLLCAQVSAYVSMYVRTYTTPWWKPTESSQSYSSTVITFNNKS